MTDPAPRIVAVVDIGKTNAKVALVDLATLAETVVARTENRVLREGPYPHYDCDDLWRFVLDGLGRAAAERPDTVVVTTHGACAALVDGEGGLALPVLDYEHDGPDSLAAEYDAARPPFSETGSPRLPGGLNLGAQLFWQQRRFADRFARAKAVLPYPQYWAWRLSGAAAAEVTSLGCHTDLWNPLAADYSSLVAAQGWRRLFAPLRAAADRLGPVRAEIAQRTGLRPGTPVLCGIHDSNASLLPHLLWRSPPFGVVSTGTWVVSMAVGASAAPLDPARDTLINVDAFGRPVPSARFMGGREFSVAAGAAPQEPGEAEIARVLSRPVLLLPAVEPGSGPFQGRVCAWLAAEPACAGERAAAVSFYLAMMASVSLELIGAAGALVVEGPFAANACFMRMLAAAAGRPVTASAGITGTSVGAALLAAVGGGAARPAAGALVPPEPALADYARRWRAALG